MTLETEKTNRQLRARVLQEGAEERMRAVQALSHHYGTGSRAALAGMMLAALGGTRSMRELTTGECDQQSLVDIHRPSILGQIAEPMEQSANDAHHSLREASSGN